MLLNILAFKSLFRRYLSEKGQGMVEYAFVLTVIVVLAAAISASGWSEGVTDIFGNVAKAFFGSSEE